MSRTKYSDVIGVWMISPLAISLMIDRSRYVSMVVTRDVPLSDLREFVSMGTKKLKVGILAEAPVLSKKELRKLLVGMDRLILVDNPEVLQKMGVQAQNIRYVSRSEWSLIKLDHEQMSKALDREQQLGWLVGDDVEVPVIGSPITRLRSKHLHRSLPALLGNSPEADVSELNAYVNLVCRYACGIEDRATFVEATKTIVRHGADPTVTPKISFHLKAERATLKKAVSWLLHFEIPAEKITEHFYPDDRRVAEELEYIASKLGDAMPDKVGLPKQLKPFEGHRVKPTVNGVPLELAQLFEKYLGKVPGRINQIAARKIASLQ